MAEQKMSREERCQQRKARSIQRKAKRREEAEARQSIRDKRTDKEQLAHLDKQGHVAKKEREKLEKRFKG